MGGMGESVRCCFKIMPACQKMPDGDINRPGVEGKIISITGSGPGLILVSAAAVLCNRNV